MRCFARCALRRFLPLAFAALASCGGGTPTPNVVLVVVDALRRDRLGAYGAEAPTSPHLDALARRGAHFDDAWSAAPWTLPSVASVLTGVHPFAHGAGVDGKPPFNLDSMAATGLAPGIETLADRLARLGYKCEAYVTNPFVARILSDGFATRSYTLGSGSDVADFGVARLAQRGSAPLFLYLHFMDCHNPILSPDEDNLAVAPPGEKPRVPQFWARTFLAAAMPDRELFLRERRLVYDGAVHFTDRQIAKVLAASESAANGRPSLFIVTSDHGEEMFEHAETAGAAARDLAGYGHGHTLYSEVLRVPLLISGPGVPARRFTDQVSLLDLVPTVLDCVGVPPAPLQLDGRSLRPLFDGKALAPAGLLAGALGYGFPKRAWITPQWHLIASETETELFDRAADPLEKKNLAADRKEVVESLLGEMAKEDRRLVRRRGPVVRMEEEDLVRMRAVGYAGGR